MRVLFTLVDDQYWADIAASCAETGLDVRLATFQRTNRPVSLPASLSLIETEHLHRLDTLLTAFGEDIDWSLQIDLPPFLEGERYYLKNSDRLMSYPQPVRERRRLYFVLYQFWLSKLREERIDAVFFRFPPHQGWDLPLFFAARQLGVVTCILGMTMVGNKLFFKDHFLAGHPVRFRPVRRNLGSKSVLEAVRTKDSARSNRFAVDPRAYARRLRKLMQLDFALGHAMTGRLRLWDKLYLMWKSRRHATALRASYEQQSVQPDTEDHFGVFFLHMQPEATTVPGGGDFDQQHMAIQILAQALPEGWKLLVKEHPAQVQTNRAARLWKRALHAFRDPWDYELIRTLPNVELVPIYQSVDALIGRSRFAATINGSAGWEALSEHGKPAVTFSPSWYGSCASCYEVNSVHDARRSIEALRTKSRAEVQYDVEEFLKENEPYWFDGAYGGFQLGLVELSYEDVVQLMRDNIVAVLGHIAHTSHLSAHTRNLEDT